MVFIKSRYRGLCLFEAMATFSEDAGFCWSSLSATLLLLLCSCTIPTAPAQSTPSGYLNIDCGANVTTVDAATGLTWVPDAPYITTGKTRSIALAPSLATFTEMGTLRYFDDLRSKNCYALPVKSGGTYLLRATFYYGNYDNANRLPMFQVTLDATFIEDFMDTSSDGAYTEIHYQAQGNVSYLCLIRASPTSGAPFISGISLKEASGLNVGYVDQYATLLQEGIIMKTQNRVNYGSSDLIRAQQDYYDRFWFPEGPATPVSYLKPATAAYEFVSTSATFSRLVGSKSRPPSAVMQTAVTSAGTLATYLFPGNWIATDMDVFVAIYYAEVNSSSSPLGNRNFTITIPEITSYSPTVDMKSWVFLNYGSWNIYLRGVNMRNTTTMFLTPLPSSTAGPIVTAIEVFELSKTQVSKTLNRDAIAIEDIKQSLNLMEWSGDPCLPSPHDWLTCAILDPSQPQPVITVVNLSGRQLNGSIPDSFSDLLDLTSLDLSSNNLSGPVPEWLTTMTALRVLSVQNNHLSDIIPAGLLSANSKIKFTYKPGNEHLFATDLPPPASKTNIARIVGESVGAVVALLVIIAAAICACRRCKRKPNLLNDQHQQGPIVKRTATTGGAKAYTLAEVTAATSNFKDELGKGGFGPVYYGKLPDGQEVAVKVAKGTSTHEEKAFFNEVDVLSRVHHKNLVSLVGYCEKEKQILLYEYMYNGSLFDHLHGDHSHFNPPAFLQHRLLELMEDARLSIKLRALRMAGKAANMGVLDWQRRLHIALNAAQGLEYLHTGCSPSFIHRDVKSSNILLTPKYDAKVADFGLTRLLGEAESSRVMTDVMGTAGYLDPEYLISHYISPKSDVYSFGIVLLELITGSLPINQFASDERNPNIAQWVRESLVKNDINSILDPVIKDSHLNIEVVWKVADIAMRSVEPKSTHRPTMSEVVQELQGALAMNATSVPSNYSSQVPEPTSFLEPR